jgi:integrase
VERAEQKARSKGLTTFAEYWQAHYWPVAVETKTAATLSSESGSYNKWLAPVLGDIQLQKVTPAILEALVLQMIKAGKKPATITKSLNTFSQVWTSAAARDFVRGECPVRRVKRPKQDNARLRFFTRNEAQLLLKALRARSTDMHDIAMLSLFAGLRAGEIHGLRWADVDFGTDLLTILDTKNGKNRHVPVVPEVQSVLQRRYTGQLKDALVFPGKNGGRRQWVSDTFERTIKDLGINNGISDARQKAVFHTLRHSYGSWLVQAGVPIFTVAKLMGHSSVLMTQKHYAHLAPDSTRSAAMMLTGALSPKPAKVRRFAAG